jgi:hypothetical protein
LGQHRAEVAGSILGRKSVLALRELPQFPLSWAAAPRGIRGIVRRSLEYLHFGTLVALLRWLCCSLLLGRSLPSLSPCKYFADSLLVGPVVCAAAESI